MMENLKLRIENESLQFKGRTGLLSIVLDEKLNFLDHVFIVETCAMLLHIAETQKKSLFMPLLKQIIY